MDTVAKKTRVNIIWVVQGMDERSQNYSLSIRDMHKLFKEKGNNTMY